MALVLNEDEVMMRDMARGSLPKKRPLKRCARFATRRMKQDLIAPYGPKWQRKALPVWSSPKNMAAWIWAISRLD